VEGITRHPPTKKIESLNMPYYELTMEDGTFCELSGQPRRTTVLYVCYPAGWCPRQPVKIYVGCVTPPPAPLPGYRPMRLRRKYIKGEE
jgi:hypothetical protein